MAQDQTSVVDLRDYIKTLFKIYYDVKSPHYKSIALRYFIDRAKQSIVRAGGQ